MKTKGISRNIGYEESVRITFTFDPDDFEIMQNIASYYNKPLSEFMRDLIYEKFKEVVEL